MFEDLENNKPAGDKIDLVNSQNTPLLGSMPSSSTPVKEKSDVSNFALADDKKFGNDFEERVKGLYSKGQKRGKRYSVIGIVGSMLILGVMTVVGYYLWSQVKDISKKVEDREQDTINLMEASSTRNDLIDRNKKSLAILTDWTACVMDDDCVETQINCCSCNSGGEQTAINKNYLANWQGEINASCQDTVCATVVNCKEGKTICDNGKCVFNTTAEEATSSAEKDIASSSLSETTDPNAPAGVSDVVESADVNTDSDVDGLSDSEELRYGTNPNNPDTDGDSYKDGDEVNGGYNPLGTGKL